MSIDKYFEEGLSSEPPRVRAWTAEGLKPHKCVFERKKEGLSFRPAILWVKLRKRDSAQPISERMLWDPEINNWLVGKRCRTLTPTNESERFGYMLRERFLRPARQYGDGFSNSVLLAVLRANSELVAHSAVGPILHEISVPAPSRNRSYQFCSEMIESVLATIGSELQTELKYPSKRARTIFIDALVYFLDERFNITNARMLGFSRG
jgi:hypothetical protein